MTTLHNKKRKSLKSSIFEEDDYQGGGQARRVARREARLNKRRDRLIAKGKTDGKRFENINRRLDDIAAGGYGQTKLGQGLRRGAGTLGDLVSMAAPALNLIPVVGSTLAPIAGAAGKMAGTLNDPRAPLGGQGFPQQGGDMGIGAGMFGGQGGGFGLGSLLGGGLGSLMGAGTGAGLGSLLGGQGMSGMLGSLGLGGLFGGGNSFPGFGGGAPATGNSGIAGGVNPLQGGSPNLQQYVGNMFGSFNPFGGGPAVGGFGGGSFLNNIGRFTDPNAPGASLLQKMPFNPGQEGGFQNFQDQTKKRFLDMSGLGDLYGNSFGDIKGMLENRFAPTGNFGFNDFGTQFQFKKGGSVKKYQTGGLVDIQAEKGEIIYHPTGFLTPVHARRTHAKMDRSKDGDMVTDHPLEDSFIFSDYLRIKKSDADQMVVGVKRHPYEEGKKGKEPEIYTLGDLFNKRDKKKSPAYLANRISNIFKVTNDKEDVFSMLADNLNLQNRRPYLEGISMLSEIERYKDDLKEEADEMASLHLAKKGGKPKRFKSRRIRGSQYYQRGGFGIDPNDIRTPTVTPFLPTIGVGGFGGGIERDDTQFVNYRDQHGNTITPGIGGPVNPGYFGAFGQPAATPQQQAAQQQYITQLIDAGDPGLRKFGKTALQVGAIGNTLGNFAGAGLTYDLYRRLLNETPEFYQNQAALSREGRQRAIDSSLNLAGFNLLQQGPEDLPGIRLDALEQYNPYRGVTTAQQLANQSLGQLNSLFNNSVNPNARADAIGGAIAANNQAIANATLNAQQQEHQRRLALDQGRSTNDLTRAQNIQRRTDFGNSLIQQTQPYLQGAFSQYASMPFDQIGFNNAQLQRETELGQLGIREPLAYLNAGFQGLANSGAGAYSLGTNYIPMQVPAGTAGGSGGGKRGFLGFLGDLGGAAIQSGALEGLFKGKAG